MSGLKLNLLPRMMKKIEVHLRSAQATLKSLPGEGGRLGGGGGKGRGGREGGRKGGEEKEKKHTQKGT